MNRILIIGGSDAGISAALRTCDIDHSYTPPLSSPRDPVQIAAQAWDKKNK
jgi:hypothetical protein